MTMSPPKNLPLSPAEEKWQANPISDDIDITMCHSKVYTFIVMVIITDVRSIEIKVDIVDGSGDPTRTYLCISNPHGLNLPHRLKINKVLDTIAKAYPDHSSGDILLCCGHEVTSNKYVECESSGPLEIKMNTISNGHHDFPYNDFVIECLGANM